MHYVVQLFTGGFVLHVKITGLDLCINNCSQWYFVVFKQPPHILLQNQLKSYVQNQIKFNVLNAVLIEKMKS